LFSQFLFCTTSNHSGALSYVRHFALLDEAASLDEASLGGYQDDSGHFT
jgi:hypothetical protein